jgi:tetraacyldisaccharide 4'-kinase
VISVGNLSVGGTGKTPLVAAIAAWLIDRGERPAILSRGYGRRLRDEGAVVVSDGVSVLVDLDHAGDEPLMLARQLPGARVVVAEERYLAGVIAERRLDATVHLLDDGFQHVSLARELDVIVTHEGEIPNGRVLPFGRLRERRDAAARADVVVVMGADAAAARAEAWALGISQAVGARRVIDAPANSPVFAIAGIGNPDQFLESLRSAGVDVRGTRTFRDHHRYTATDVAGIAEDMRRAGAAQVMTTEKDAVRLEPLAPLPFPLVTARVRLEFDPAETLFACVEAALARARTAA